MGVGAGDGETLVVATGVFVGSVLGVEVIVGVERGVPVGVGWLHDIATRISKKTMPTNEKVRKLEPPCDYGRDPVAKQGFLPLWATRGREGPNS